MPRLTKQAPKYGHHKPSNQARVRIQGKDYWLGKYGSPESKAEYHRLLAEFAVSGAPPEARRERSDLTVAELLTRYLEFADDYYRVNGKPSREAANIRDAIRPLRKLYAHTEASDFGPIKLKAVRAEMVKAGLARNTINARINRIRRVFRWSVENELIGPDVAAKLDAVAAIRSGRGGRETEAVAPVAWGTVEAILPHLTPLVRAMVLFGWYTGARPSEITTLTTGSIDRTGRTWVACPAQHKNAHRGIQRAIMIGPHAQAALGPWLIADQPDAPIFSPRRVDERQPKRRGARRPGRSYSRGGFARAIVRACERANVPTFSPNQLRHAAAGRIESAHGIDAARCVLGHASPDTTKIYLERDIRKAQEVALAIG